MTSQYVGKISYAKYPRQPLIDFWEYTVIVIGKKTQLIRRKYDPSHNLIKQVICSSGFTLPSEGSCLISTFPLTYFGNLCNPLTPMSDQDRTPPYHINTTEKC